MHCYNFLLHQLKRIPLNKFNYENVFNIISDVEFKNNFDIKTKKN